jgi:hypothetical protein
VDAVLERDRLVAAGREEAARVRLVDFFVADDARRGARPRSLAVRTFSLRSSICRASSVDRSFGNASPSS